MKITFIKDHLSYKAGDTATVSQERANYLIKMKVASEESSKPAAKLQKKVAKKKKG